MKECFKCHGIKPLSEFYRHKQMADGHLNKCKDCTRKDVKENRRKRLEQYKEYDAWRFQNDPRVKARHASYKNTPRGRASFNAAKLRWSKNNPEKRAAHIILNNAIRSGRLLKPNTCSSCCATVKPRNLHAHHSDYAFPLDVVWLCVQCHVDVHKNIA